MKLVKHSLIVRNILLFMVLCGVLVCVLLGSYRMGVAHGRLIGQQDGEQQTVHQQVEFDLVCSLYHYSSLKSIETDELKSEFCWNRVLGDLLTKLYCDLLYIDCHPEMFPTNGIHGVEFTKKIQEARTLTEGKRFATLRQISEKAIGTTNLIVEEEQDKRIRFTRRD